MNIRTFIIAVEGSRGVGELFDYTIGDEKDLQNYFERLFGDFADLNYFEQGVYNRILNILSAGYTVLATIETESNTQQYDRIIEFIENNDVIVINDTEI